ncbi:MAG: sulfatase-like hydrolase/transferase [Pseudomonadota bacterium]
MMHRPTLHRVLGLLLVTGIVQAQVAVDARMSGSWYDPGRDGEGFVLQVLPDERAVVYWFTYDETGAQRWFVASGDVSGPAIVFENLWQTRGARFGDAFDPAAVERTDVGELTLRWTACDVATASYEINGVSGEQALDRLTRPAGLECGAPDFPSSALTGSWFDPTHDGEGLAIEALDDGRAVVYWFSYDSEGNQAWFVGAGAQDDGLIAIDDMTITEGGRFGPDFDPADVTRASWGSLAVELGCDFGKLDYLSSLEPFGSGKQTLNRLTRVGAPACEEAPPPNIVLIVADDLGLDASNQYAVGAAKPSTPVLDRLADDGLVFDNAWSNPSCTPTRAGILTGRYGSRTRVLQPGDVLSTDETSVQSYIRQHLPGRYADAVIGKWHLAGARGRVDHPNVLGVSHYAGVFGGGVGDYRDWTLTINEEQRSEFSYVTSGLVDLAIEWTNAQDQPWFLWLAFNAPHTPFHEPPAALHGQALPGSAQDISENPLPYYHAAIEAMDTEIGRFLDSLAPVALANTLVIFVGDNGTPGAVSQAPFGRGRSKGSLYQGGINVPLFVSGAGVTRVGEREAALVDTTDLFGTIAALAGVNVDGINDSVSFAPLLREARSSTRVFQFSEQNGDDGERWAVSDGVHKLIEDESGSRELYALLDDPFEEDDLIAAGAAPDGVVDDLAAIARGIREGADDGNRARTRTR